MDAWSNLQIHGEVMNTLALHTPAETATAMLDAVGRPLRDLRLSVIDQCNFRCTYCMPRETFGPDYPFLPADQRLSLDEMFTLAATFATLGVRKIRLTGGEPLLRRGIESLVERLSGLRTLDGQPMEIALTTNGVLLAEKAAALRDAGLTRVTVSLDALDDAIFRQMSGANMPVARVLEGIAAASAAGLAPVKVNTVVERGVNDSQILPLVHFFKGTGITLRFIEYMDVGGASSWATDKVVTAQEVRAIVESAYPLVPSPRGQDGETAMNYLHMDGGGELGFIASVSQPFCGDCSRARISSDGQLYTCLFATQGLDLKPWLKNGDQADGLQGVLRRHWSRRDDRYSELRSESASGRRAYPVVRMSLVGG
jgi:cyclic pyranopterin phosphate synthase